MSPRRDRNKSSNKREHSNHARGENGSSENSRGSYSSNEVWTEHVSSSGKKYYYNSLLGISQWDKPSDWVDPPSRRNVPNSRDEDMAEHSSSKRYKESSSSNHASQESSYRDQHNDSRNRDSSRNPHYSHTAHNTEVQVLHDTDTSSGGSTPVLDTGNKMKPIVQDVHNSVPMVSALPRNLSHQQVPSTPSVPYSSAMNHCAPFIHSDPLNRHTPVLLSKSKIEGIQNTGAYGNFTQSESPMLSPSLSKYVSNELVKHVTGWPAEVLERQAQKYSDEAYTLGDLQCMRVCTELKCARAVVRHMEIKATLQDQKLMYLRQQIESIKEVKSQNSIISNDL